MRKYCSTGNIGYWHTMSNSESAGEVAIVYFQHEICRAESEGSVSLAVAEGSKRNVRMLVKSPRLSIGCTELVSLDEAGGGMIVLCLNRGRD